MTKTTRLTSLAIERTKARETDLWLSDNEGTRGGGRLVVRISASGSRLFYFRYSIDGKRKLLPMLPFSKDSSPGCHTLDEARELARRYSGLHRNAESKDVAEYMRSLRDQADAQKAAQEEAQREADEAESVKSKHTLKKLCGWYVEHLERQGKQSAKGVQSICRCHIDSTELADLAASSITAKQFTGLLRKIVEQDKGRTAAKVRSALHAAYGLAVRAETDATAPAELIAFGIESNPIASTAALSRFSKARDRTLTRVELKHLLEELEVDDPTLAARAVRLGLYLGGQRALQLLRARITQIDWDEETLTIFDGKGRRDNARAHVLPLNKGALTQIKELVARAEALDSDYLFASRGSHMDSGAMSGLVNDLSKRLMKKRVSTQPFQFSDLRRTAETLMASLAVSKDIRAQIQSHGISGVQARHYDRYEYMKEKRNALRSWERLLSSVTSDQIEATNIRSINQRGVKS